MLILTRKPNQVVIVGEGANKVAVTLLSIDGDRIRLGFHAASQIPIYREEAVDKTKKPHLRPKGTDHKS